MNNETSFNHALGEEAAKYYWIRHKRVISKRRSKQKTTIFSAYHPSGVTSGVPGTAKSPAQITVNLTNPSMTLQQTNAGSINYAATGTDIQVILGENILINDQSGSQANSSFRVAVSASNITAGSESTVNDANSNATIFRIGNHGNATSDTPVITYTITEYLDGKVVFDKIVDGRPTPFDVFKFNSYEDLKEVFEKDGDFKVEITKEEDYKAVMNPKMFDNAGFQGIISS